VGILALLAYDTGEYTKLPPGLFRRQSAMPTQPGKQMPLSRRPVEAGAGCVTVRSYGRDVHGDKKSARVNNSMAKWARRWN
jgi:hypothetical protein